MRSFEIFQIIAATHRSPIVIGLMVLSCFSCFAQKKKLTYYDHVEPIILKNCAPCHSPGQGAPFSLLTYSDVVKRGDFVAEVTGNKYMPPWKADVGFQSYRNQRTLSEQEILTIKNWVAGGMAKGKKSKNTASAVLAPKEKPDLTVMMQPYSIGTDNQDDYRFFNIPTNLPKDQYISKIEFVPGNARLVHHSRLMTDTSHMVRTINGLSANDERVSEFEKYPPIDKFLYGYVPGNFPISFPPGTGKKLHKDTDIILNIHYAPNGRPGQSDQSKINFYFTKEKAEREVFSLAIAEESISNKPFLIKANETATFYASFGPIPIDISVIGVLPHMHYRGKTFKAFAITKEDEAIHLIKIDAWDFKWQDTYQFKKLLKIPKGSVILIETTFDNTNDNPANPVTPAVDVTYGWNTTSEMMDLVLYYLNYKEGDENLEY
jgi:hypothetical protein